MTKLVFILATTLGSIAVGYLARIALTRNNLVSDNRALTISRVMKLAAFFCVQPIAIISTFWAMSLVAGPVLLFPILGLFSVFVSGGAALLSVRLLQIPDSRAASVFVAGTFTNVLTFGGLIGFVFFDEPGYSLAQLFTTFISASYYLVGYPISGNIARGASRVLRVEPRAMAEHPLLFVPIGAMAAGAGLNFAGIHRPEFVGMIVELVVPTVAVLLGMSIGMSLRFSTVNAFKREVGAVMLIKFVILPLVMVPIGLLLGLPSVGDGTAFKMLVVLSVMPVAFNALVPPALYGFDLDLANAAWLVTTAALIVLVPLLSILLT